MANKTKNIPLGGHTYRLRKLGVDEGSHIFMRMMGAIIEARSKLAHQSTDEPTEEESKKLTDEERAKVLVGLSFMNGFSFEDAKFARHQALLAVDRVETLATGEVCIQIMLTDGRWSPTPDGWPDLEEDAATRQELVVEALTFSIAPFFSKAGAKS
jgi:hypothetical protein